MRYIELWIDHPAVGCGVRRFVDLTRPRAKQATLFYVPTLAKFSIDLRALKGAKELPLNKTQLRALRARIRAKLREHQRLGLSVTRARKRAKTVLATIDAEP